MTKNSEKLCARYRRNTGSGKWECFEWLREFLLKHYRCAYSSAQCTAYTLQKNSVMASKKSVTASPALLYHGFICECYQCECASVCSTSTVHNNYWLNLQLLQIIFEFCTGNFRKMKCPMRNPFASLSFSSIY